MASLEILYYMHNFQKRFCWALSSICQQNGTIPDLTITIASMPYNGNPTTEDLIDFYRDKFKIKHMVFTENQKDVFSYLGLIKNICIKESTADWMFFPDADHVYHPDFFGKMHEAMETNPTYDGVIGSRGRINTDVEATDKLINSTKDFFIENAYEKALKLPVLQTIHKRPRMGSHFIFRRSVVMEKFDGNYAPRRYDKNMFTFGMRSLSDRRFKMKMNSLKSYPWPAYIHLNHVRDKELGYHTEEQR